MRYNLQALSVRFSLDSMSVTDLVFTCISTGTFANIEHVLLVGVAGGVVCVDDDARHVRLGDVIVSLSDGARPVYIEKLSSGFRDSGNKAGEADVNTWSAPDPYLGQIYKRLKRTPKGFYKRLDQFIREGYKRLCSIVLL